MAIGDMQLTAVGNLTVDPELRFIPNGTPVAVFSIAVNAKEFDKSSGGYRDVDPSFVRVECWRSLAENVAESLTRGTRVIVSGRWRERHWVDGKTEEKRSGWTLTADSVGLDLTWVSIKPDAVRKSVRRKDAAPPDDPWASGSPKRPETADTSGGQPSGGFSDDPPF
ncbi:single-stranded DNA-binding protein [Actinomadura sp. 9N215]|uniref:single-stranded DNA-binding protein n=1 Tax=Actinomadura sp. 9N215 TaxID=3375150 RepID=UPI00379C0984